MAERTCSIEGCERRHEARGLCNMHYLRLRVRGSIGSASAERKPSTVTVCFVEGCDALPYAWNMCNPHYLRTKRHGSPFGGQRRVASVPVSVQFVSQTQRLESGCLLWTGRLTPQGYPQTSYSGPVAMHRWVYEQSVGPVPAGWTVDHRCHNEDETCKGGEGCLHRRCVERDHLEAVPHGLNTMRGFWRRNITIEEYLNR